MRKQIKYLVWCILLVLLIANAGLFVSTIKLSNEINTFEKETQRLHQINIDLEKEISQYDSYQFIASQAANLGFVRKSSPLYLDNLRYAFKQ